MNSIELKINKIVQGFISLNEGIEWFDNCDVKLRESILQSLSYFLSQSHPTQEEVVNGIKLSGLKQTFTPFVLMMTRPFSEAIDKIKNLPPNEWEKAFILFISIFSIADKRRRETTCLNGCTHEWHNIEYL